METTYFSIKATMLDGRVLRSRSVPGLDQEVYALLATYQALIHTAADAVTTRPGLAMERISFTVLLQAAADQATTASRYTRRPGPTPCSDRSAGWSWTTCCPPRGASASRPAAARTQRASTGRTQENTRKPPRPLPFLSRSTSWNTDLHHAAAGKRNGVGLRLLNRSPARAAHHALGDL
ncbi:hypothetical protein ACFIN9_00565 [Streptomyces noursei]|uniref:hypothetical protein n=1 Tax=Streptomyces noursei TaxID=1971 RepID=UPI0036D2357E